MQNIFCFIFCCFFIGLNFSFVGSASAATPQGKTLISNISLHTPNIPVQKKSAKQDAKLLMTVGLILSITGSVLLPFYFPFAIIISSLGAILGFLGIMKLRKIREKKWGLGIAAIIIGGLPLFLLTLLLYVFVIVFQLVEPIFL